MVDLVDVEDVLGLLLDLPDVDREIIIKIILAAKTLEFSLHQSG